MNEIYISNVIHDHFSDINSIEIRVDISNYMDKYNIYNKGIFTKT